MNTQKLILIGGGGHCRSSVDVIESAGKFSISGILDLEHRIGEKVLNYPIIDTEDSIERFVAANYGFIITIGFIKSASPRITSFNRVKKLQGLLPVVQSAFAVVAKSANIQEGSVIFHKAVVNTNATIGTNAIINTAAVIEHDVVIGDHSHISTGAIVNGGCKIGLRCFIGSGTIIKEGITVADDVIIGAGSVVVKDIIESGIYYGIPARK